MEKNRPIKRALLFFACAIGVSAAIAEELTIDALYEKFNMRSIRSSYGQRLKYFCQSYPKDFYPASAIVQKSATKILLSYDGDSWEMTIIGKNRIRIGNAMAPGTYNSTAEYDVEFNSKARDWRATETLIAVPEPCVDYPRSGVAR